MTYSAFYKNVLSVYWASLIASSVTSCLFIPLSVHLTSHMHDWTPVLSLCYVVNCLFIAVGMQCSETYTLLETGQEYGAHLHLKRYTPKQFFFRYTPKMPFSSCYNKWSELFGFKLQRHILGTPKNSITSCKKEHNKWHLNICFRYKQLLIHSPVNLSFAGSWGYIFANVDILGQALSL